jgi:hypothetical protein
MAGCCLQKMSKATSPYYPPRARWYAPVFYVANMVRRGIAMDRIYLPGEVTWPGLALSFLVPGLGFYLRGPRIWGKTVMAGCALLFFLFIIGFGYPYANFAFGMIISAHVSGIVYYCAPILQEWELRTRLLFTVLVLAGVGLSIYLPSRAAIQNHWLMPLRVNGQGVVVQKLASPKAVKRGDWIAYRLPARSEGVLEEDWRMFAHSGVGLGPVLAVANDQVVFSNNVVIVNGVAQPLLPHMPTYGAITVPENFWFIWPGYSINGRGDERRITSMMLQLANVPENEFIGRPLKRWFWRKQVLP